MAGPIKYPQNFRGISIISAEYHQQSAVTNRLTARPHCPSTLYADGESQGLLVRRYVSLIRTVWG